MSNVPLRLIDAAMTGMSAETQEVDRVCERHGPYKAKTISLPFLQRATETKCPRCQEEEASGAPLSGSARGAENTISRRNAVISAMIAASGIPPRYRGRTFTNFEIPMQGGELLIMALAACSAVADEFPDRLRRAKGALIYGDYRVGKTHLAAAIIQAVAQRGYESRYATAAQFLDDMREAISSSIEESGARKKTVMNRFAGVDLLVLDEVYPEGGRQLTPFEMVALGELIDIRLGWNRPTIVVSNKTPAVLADYLGEKIWGRLSETGWDLIEIRGRSYSPQVQGNRELPVGEEKTVDWDDLASRFLKR